MKTFLKDFDAIVIFGNYRYGSTALCNILHNFLIDNHVDSFNWSEYLSMNQYITDSDNGLITKSMSVDYIPYDTDVIKLATRPIPSFIVRSKLEFFEKIIKKKFVIFKITPDDFGLGNDELIDKHILNNPRIFKIGLNRQDVSNAIISYVTATYFNIWHPIVDITEFYEEEVSKKKVSLEYLNRITNRIIIHNTWLYLNHNKLNHFVWYDELPQLTIEPIGLYNFTTTHYEKNPIPHTDRAKKYFSNGDELVNVLEIFDKEIQPLIKNVRNVSTYIKDWKY